MSTPRRLAPLALAIAIAGAAVPAAQAAEGDPVTWVVAPYIWAPSVSADLETPSGGSGGGNTDFFPDIVDKIEGGFLGHVEAQGDQFGFMSDVLWLKLGDGNEFALGDTDADLSTWLVDVAGVWSPGPERFSGFELYAGLRYIDIELDASFEPTNPDFARREIGPSESFADFLAGVRYIAHFNDNWSMTFRGDGSWGQTEGTYLAAATLGWSPGNGTWGLGWRYMNAEIGNDDENLELDLSGPVFGYAFVF
jgi:hypothetical protein